jgi:hypothetical protein
MIENSLKKAGGRGQKVQFRRGFNTVLNELWGFKPAFLTTPLKACASAGEK